MPWYAIVLPVVRSNDQWAASGPSGEPGQLTQPADVVIPPRSSLPWAPQNNIIIQPASWVDGQSRTVWYFPGCFNLSVDPSIQTPAIAATTVTVVTSAWAWYARFRGLNGNSSRTFSGERPTQAGAKLACYVVIKAIDNTVTDAMISDSTDMGV